MCMSLTVDSKGKQEWMNENKYVKVSGLLLGVEGDGKVVYCSRLAMEGYESNAIEGCFFA